MTTGIGACPRCGGFIKADRDQYGAYQECVMCGYMHDISVPPLLKSLRSEYAIAVEGGLPESGKPGQQLGRRKPVQVYEWTWERDIPNQGAGNSTWKACITLFYAVRKNKNTKVPYAKIVDVKGWPFGRWSADAGRPHVRFGADFRAEMGMCYHGLEGVLRFQAQEYQEQRNRELNTLLAQSREAAI